MSRSRRIARTRPRTEPFLGLDRGHSVERANAPVPEQRNAQLPRPAGATVRPRGASARAASRTRARFRARSGLRPCRERVFGGLDRKAVRDEVAERDAARRHEVQDGLDVPALGPAYVPRRESPGPVPRTPLVPPRSVGARDDEVELLLVHHAAVELRGRRHRQRRSTHDRGPARQRGRRARSTGSPRRRAPHRHRGRGWSNRRAPGRARPTRRRQRAPGDRPVGRCRSRGSPTRAGAVRRAGRSGRARPRERRIQAPLLSGGSRAVQSPPEPRTQRRRRVTVSGSGTTRFAGTETTSACDA